VEHFCVKIGDLAVYSRFPESHLHRKTFPVKNVSQKDVSRNVTQKVTVIASICGDIVLV